MGVPDRLHPWQVNASAQNSRRCQHRKRGPRRRQWPRSIQQLQCNPGDDRRLFTGIPLSSSAPRPLWYEQESPARMRFLDLETSIVCLTGAFMTTICSNSAAEGAFAQRASQGGRKLSRRYGDLQIAPKNAASDCDSPHPLTLGCSCPASTRASSLLLMSVDNTTVPYRPVPTNVTFCFEPNRQVFVLNDATGTCQHPSDNRIRCSCAKDMTVIT